VLIPQWFANQLRAEFGSRFSVRWSHARSCFVIDEQVARGQAMPPARLAAKLARLDRTAPDQADEFRHRLRTGTAPFVEVYPSNRAPCPACAATVRLSFQEWQFAHCTACQKDFKAVSSPLGWWLLEQLRFLDFERGGDERQLAAMDTANAAHEQALKRNDRNTLEAAVKDDFARIMDIQSVGYTGREFAPAQVNHGE
jgi:hypothetical protein